MPAGGAFPYLVPPVEAVDFRPWEVFDGEWRSLPRDLESWDPDVTLSVRRRVRVDYESVLAGSGLGRGSTFALTSSWVSNSSGMSRRFAQTLVSEPGAFTLSGELQGQYVSGKLDLVTTLTLLEPAKRRESAVVVSTPGAVIARHVATLTIEPTTTRFPITVMDFASTKNDPNASWRLDTSLELLAPFYGSFLLYINSRDRDLVRAIEARNPNEAQLVLLATLEEGVTSLLFELALAERRSLVEQDEWPAGSVGAILQTFLQTAVKYGLSGAPDDISERPAFASRLSGLVRARAHGRQFT